MHGFDAALPRPAYRVAVQGNGAAIKKECPRVGPGRAGQKAHEGGLSRAVVPEQGHDLPFPDVQIGMAQGRNRAERLT